MLFPYILLFFGKEATLGSCSVGKWGMGCVIQVCSMHWLREFMISWKLFCASYHYVCESCSCCNVCVRLAVFRLCSSKNVVCSCCRLVGGMGYLWGFYSFVDYAIKG